MLNPQIGETAGNIWRTLETEGPLRLAALKKEVDAPDMVFFMALGWLAREDKLAFDVEGRAYRVQLK